MLRYIKILPILLVLIICSCGKEDTTFTPVENSTQIKSTLTGIVLDVNDEPISDAKVYYNGSTVTTNNSGIYEFANVSVDSKHNSIAVSKAGFFDAARTFRSSTAKEIFHQTILLPVIADQSFQSSQGGEVVSGSVTIDFEPNSIVFKSNDNEYNGTVQVAISYLDPTDSDFDRKMPGDLTSINDDNIILKSTSYGMAYVELLSGSGDALQIKKGSKAKLKIKIPEDLKSFAPQTLEAGHFDEGLGMWRIESSAILEGDSYVADVTHFSCWSYNSSLPSVVITGRIVDQSGLPVPGLRIQISESNNWGGGYGTAGQDGVFTGAVPKDVPLNLYIYNSYNCPGQAHLFSDNIGPFNNDVNIGDIVIDASSLEFITIEASFFNCEDEPVTNGVAYAAHHYFKITDGTLNVMVPACESDLNLILWVHDLDTDKVTGQYPLVVGELNDFGPISVCQIEARFFEIIAPGLGLDEISMVEIGAWFEDEEKTIFGFYNADLNEDVLQIKIEYADANPNGFEVGTWPISVGEIEVGVFPSVLTYQAGNGEGEVKITEVGVDGLSNYIKGNYRVNFKEINTGADFEFSGDFLLRTN